MHNKDLKELEEQQYKLARETFESWPQWKKDVYYANFHVEGKANNKKGCD